MRNILVVLQIIVGTLLVGAILIQSKGTGFARSFGSGQHSFTRRGLEKFVFKATFVLAFIFILISIIQLAL